MTVEITTVDLLRHGEARGGAVYRGSRDDELTALGWQAMEARCAGGDWDSVVSSPLLRCRGFGEVYAARRALPFHTLLEWREIDFGAWEGRSATEIQASDPARWAAFCERPHACPPPGGEAYADFAARVGAGWRRVIDDHAGQRVLAVCHAGVIRCLFSVLLGLPVERGFAISVPHAGLTRFTCYRDGGGEFVRLEAHLA
ncbi:histidine phosphatase family protein [Methylomonas sp. LWB]|uniref:histidine phosphatase family protein n=1 Tax=Methylomonas sp. LWB TaxID=1905845 RepID=UPI000AD29EAF|nr:histidine phosphatase family protein [Methylomonas sp. LWB]